MTEQRTHFNDTEPATELRQYECSGCRATVQLHVRYYPHGPRLVLERCIICGSDIAETKYRF